MKRLLLSVGERGNMIEMYKLDTPRTAQNILNFMSYVVDYIMNETTYTRDQVSVSLIVIKPESWRLRIISPDFDYIIPISFSGGYVEFEVCNNYLQDIVTSYFG